MNKIPKLVEIYSKTFYEDEYVAEISLKNSGTIVGYISEKGILNLDLDLVTEDICKDLAENFSWIKFVMKELK